MTFRDRLRSGRPLLGDGANGTLLAELGHTGRPDAATLDNPDLVRESHRRYLAAGADFVETNTYAANRLKYGSATDIAHLNREAARLAREAAAEFTERYVLGAIGPAGKKLAPIGPYRPEDVTASVVEQATALAEGGVDGFFLETFDDVDELKLAVEAVRAVSDLPIVACKAYIEDGGLLAEGLPHRVAGELGTLRVDAVGANCIVGPQRMLDLVRMIAEGTDLPVAAFPTPGLPQLVKGEVVYDLHPDYFAKAALRLIEGGATIVGGCCGTLPEHIAELRKAIDGHAAKPRRKSAAHVKAASEEPLPETPPTRLLEKLRRGEFVRTVELDVPRGLILDGFLAAADALKAAGADVINVSDGARARLRMNPSAVAHLVQTRVGVEATMHFACRDRNLLAIQADLLAIHALGVRNVLAVTGDPANIGDYPSATSVFDIDAIGLVRILARFNEGRDLAGYSLKTKAGFTIACAFNPLARDPEGEMERLRRKADAGAHVIYTQPVFAKAQVDACVSAAAAVGLPVLVGLLPLRNARHAEFMANEVPGIEVPLDLLRRMVEAPSDAAALALGMEEARGLAAKIRNEAAGLYVMPPAGKADLAAELMAV